MLSSLISFGKAVDITDVEIRGLKRTHPSIVLKAANVQVPCSLQEEDLLEIQKKIETTHLFSYVKVFVEGAFFPRVHLIIEVAEKWTLIPVIRGQYGGGTPLFVFGFYDTNIAGRQITLGAEAHRYGQGDPGYVAYLRWPSPVSFVSLMGFEQWDISRKWDIYGDKKRRIEHIEIEKKRSLLKIYFPIKEYLQAGFLFFYDRYKAQHLPSGERFSYSDFSPTFSYQYSIIWDNISAYQKLWDGFRLLVYFTDGWQSPLFFKMEGFSYIIPFERMNIVSHFLLQETEDTKFSLLNLIGGFDAVRGYPDGYMIGNKTLYANFEMRYLLKQARYLDSHVVGFFDAGQSSFSHENWTKLNRAYGLGVRLSVPQVNRLMLRFDVAFSEFSPQLQISAGMNQLFDPYRPL